MFVQSVNEVTFLQELEYYSGVYSGAWLAAARAGIHAIEFPTHTYPPPSMGGVKLATAACGWDSMTFTH